MRPLTVEAAEADIAAFVDYWQGDAEPYDGLFGEGLAYVRTPMGDVGIVRQTGAAVHMGGVHTVIWLRREALDSADDAIGTRSIAASAPMGWRDKYTSLPLGTGGVVELDCDPPSVTVALSFGQIVVPVADTDLVKAMAKVWKPGQRYRLDLTLEVL